MQFVIFTAATLSAKSARGVVAAVGERSPQGRQRALRGADQAGVAGLGQEGVEARIAGGNAVDVDATRTVWPGRRRVAGREANMGNIRLAIHRLDVKL